MMEKDIRSLVSLWRLHCNVELVVGCLLEGYFVVCVFTVLKCAFQSHRQFFLIMVEVEYSLDFACFFDLVINVEETVTLAFN
jgi:hypothetical protein